MLTAKCQSKLSVAQQSFDAAPVESGWRGSVLRTVMEMER